MLKILFLPVAALIFTLLVPVSALAAGMGDKVSKAYKPLVVQISADFARGNEDGFGFIVGEEGGFFYIVTANHVVRTMKSDNPTRKVWLRFFWDPGGKRKDAELLGNMHKRHDLALLRIAKDKVFMADKVSWGKQAYCKEWIDEEPVWFIGRQKKWYVPSDRRAGGMINTEADLDGIVHFDINSIKPGSSGAPLIIEKGIVGMVIEDVVDEARAVNIDLVRRFVSKAYPDAWNLDPCGTTPPASEPVQDNTMTEKFTNMEFVRMSEGCFQMGSPQGEDGHVSDEGPVHEVCVDNFWIGKYEVTQGEWRTIMHDNPSGFKKGDSYPVESVSWNEVQSFIKKLNNKSGKQFRLPTEAEWEYACRANEPGQYCGGDNVDALAWYADNSGGSTHPVGLKEPNGFKLYDMSGNVWEWCQDWYGEDYYGNSPRKTPKGPTFGSNRVIRGGSWIDYAGVVRSALRDWYAPVNRHDGLGFRLVLSPGQ